MYGKCICFENNQQFMVTRLIKSLWLLQVPQMLMWFQQWPRYKCLQVRSYPYVIDDSKSLIMSDWYTCIPNNSTSSSVHWCDSPHVYECNGYIWLANIWSANFLRLFMANLFLNSSVYSVYNCIQLLNMVKKQ